MKKLTLYYCLAFVFSLLSFRALANDKYFILRTDDPKYEVKSYTLHTDSLYGIHKEVELFNIYPEFYRHKGGFTEQNIYLFSVLPDLLTDENWLEISLDSIINDTLSFSQLRHLASRSIMDRFDLSYGEDTKYLNDYKLVLFKNDKYYVAKNTFLQFFAIRNRPDFFNSPYGTINTMQRLMSINEFRTMYKNVYPYDIFPLDGANETYGHSFDKIRDRKEFLSKIFVIKNLKAYQFWTLMDWGGPIARSLNGYEFYRVERGIDRFVYIPNLGIVGGSFDFYFWRNRKLFGFNALKLNSNINQERIMLAQVLLQYMARNN